MCRGGRERAEKGRERGEGEGRERGGGVRVLGF